MDLMQAEISLHKRTNTEVQVSHETHTKNYLWLTCLVVFFFFPQCWGWNSNTLDKHSTTEPHPEFTFNQAPRVLSGPYVEGLLLLLAL